MMDKIAKIICVINGSCDFFVGNGLLRKLPALPLPIIILYVVGCPEISCIFRYVVRVVANVSELSPGIFSLSIGQFLKR